MVDWYLGRPLLAVVAWLCVGTAGCVAGEVSELAPAARMPPARDAGVVVDASVGVPDAGETRPDAGATRPDAAVSSFDAGTLSDAGLVTPVDAGFEPADSGLVAVLVAQGVMGRTMLSCDDGQTWVSDRSFDREEVDGQGRVTAANDMVCGDTQQVRCDESSCRLKQADGSCTVAAVCDCLHHPGYAKGVAIAGAQLLANFGWGHPGIIMRSTDGAGWVNSHAFDGSELFPNIVYGAGRFVHFSSQPEVSDDGVNWRNGGFANFNGPGQSWVSPRAFEVVQTPSGARFIGALDGDELRVSADRAESWFSPANVPSGCTEGIGNAQQILSGNGVALIVTSSGRACRSADGGNTWSLHTITSEPLNVWGAFVGGQFLVFSTTGTRFHSADGVSWHATAMSKPTSLGAVGVSVKGTLVAVGSVWQGYERQTLLRSTDEGLSWVELGPGAFRRGHPLHRFSAGLINRAGSPCQ